MTEPTDPTLRIEVGPVAADGRTKVFVHRGDDVVHADRLDLASARSRRSFIEDCKAKIPNLPDTEIEALEHSLVGLAAETATADSPTPVDVPTDVTVLVQARDRAADEALARMPADIVAEAEQLLADPNLMERVQADLGAVGIAGEKELSTTLYAVGTSRLLDNPLSAMVLGPSSSGKSFTIEGVGRMFPPEAVFNTTDLTANALYYVPEDALIHMFVVAGERPHRKRDEQAESKRSLREMISSRVLRKTVTTKAESGEMVTKTFVRYGPIAYVESTTQTDIFNEDANRVLALATDESPEQTRRVLDRLADRAVDVTEPDRRVIERHHALQRLLRRVRIRIPFARAILRQVPSSRPEARRAAGQILSLIQAIALLHQRQRVPPGTVLSQGDAIDATIEDYVIARRLLLGPLGRLLGSDLQPAIANFGRRVVARWKGAASFTAAQAAERDDTIKDAEVARRYLNQLSRVHVVDLVEVGRGGKPNLYRVTGQVPEPGATWLPTVNVLLAAGAGTAAPPAIAPAPPVGCLVRQPADARETSPASPISAEVCPPAPAVRLAAADGQLGSEDTESRDIRHTEPHQTGRLPADGSDWLFEPEISDGGAGNQTHPGDGLDDSDVSCASGWRKEAP